MSSIIQFDSEKLELLSLKEDKDYVLDGLARGKLAFVISSPEVGKGYLSLSIAYELATQIKLIGISGVNKPLKTLYWPIEDGVESSANRILSHLKFFKSEQKKQIKDNVSLLNLSEPLFFSGRADINNEKDKIIKSVIKNSVDYDLLIIDTLREAIGHHDEVDDDNLIKMGLQKIAKEANVAILCIHHLTKAASKGLEKVTNVSGSGFSKTLANSRLQFYLEKRIKKNSKDFDIYISHIKSNNIPVGKKIVDRNLIWNDYQILCTKKISYPKELSKVSDTVDSIDSLNNIPVPQEFIEEEAININISDSILSEESINKQAEHKKNSEIFTDEDVSEYKDYLASKK